MRTFWGSIQHKLIISASIQTRRFTQHILGLPVFLTEAKMNFFGTTENLTARVEIYQVNFFRFYKFSKLKDSTWISTELNINKESAIFILINYVWHKMQLFLSAKTDAFENPFIWSRVVPGRRVTLPEESTLPSVYMIKCYRFSKPKCGPCQK